MKGNNVMSHYKTPGAIRQDAHTLTEDATALLEATAEIADKKVADARRRLADALDQGKEVYAGIQEKVVQGAKVADQCVRDHPYQSMAFAFGIGTLLGLL